MRTRSDVSTPRRFAVAVLLGALAACGSRKASGEVHADWRGGTGEAVEASAATCRIVGHVLDRATGEPVVGARIEGPGNRSAVSDARGWFELTGLRPGDEGVLRATWGRDRSVESRLRPLAAGRLEVVLHLGP